MKSRSYALGKPQLTSQSTPWTAARNRSASDFLSSRTQTTPHVPGKRQLIPTPMPIRPMAVKVR